MKDRYRTVATFTAGLLVGGLIVGSIATSAMHAGKTKIVNDCHETAVMLRKSNDRVECPMGSTAEVSFYSLEDTSPLVICRCSAPTAPEVPQDDIETPETIQPRSKLLEL